VRPLVDGKRARRLMLGLLIVVIGCAACLSWMGATRVVASALVPRNVDTLLSVIRLIDESFVYPVDWERFWSSVLRAVVRALGDPYSEYLTSEEYRELGREGGTGGIGILVQTLDGRATIVSVAPESPAARAGLEVGDVVVEVDGRLVYGVSGEEVLLMTQGPPGSRLTMVVLSRSGKVKKVSVLRETTSGPTIRLHILPGNIGYLRVARFEANTARDFATVVEVLRDRGVYSYVLDLRGNPGGLLSEAVGVAEVFVPKGVLGYVMDKRGRTTILRSNSEPWNFRLVTLVDTGTASAAEVVAMALKDRRVGVLVGTRTLGKGLVQNVYPLPDGGALRLSVARYLGPAGTAIQGRGVTPDYIVPSGKRHLTDPTQLPPFSTSRQLRSGLSGSDVRVLQLYLRACGFDPGPVDGIFGPRTQAALRSFQQSQGLTPSGVLDPESAAAIKRAAFEWPLFRSPGDDPQLEKALSLLK